MPNSSRHIDKLPPVESGTVEVLVVGLSRTGTMSMYTALKMLDYKCYHMYEACVNAGQGHLIFWNEAIDAKFGDAKSGSPSQVKPYTSSDFHKFLQKYNALSDAPTVLFVPELMAAYSNARLILTTHPRGVDGWLASMRNSYFRICNWRVWSWLLIPYDTAFSRPYQALLRRIIEVWTGREWSAARDFEAVRAQLRETYFGHAEQVRTLAQEQGRPLLEFDPAKGWGPLCEFLGKDVPLQPYPRANVGDDVANLHKRIVQGRLVATFKTPVLSVVGGLVAVVTALWWLRP